jgi:hypothetical protein
MNVKFSARKKGYIVIGLVLSRSLIRNLPVDGAHRVELVSYEQHPVISGGSHTMVQLRIASISSIVRAGVASTAGVANVMRATT